MTAQVDIKGADYKKCRERAQEILAENFISEPPVPIFELVRNYGLLVVEMNFKPEYQSVSGTFDIEKSTIILNHADEPVRKAFTVAHQLGHWLLHRQEMGNDLQKWQFNRYPMGKKELDTIEKEANAFAVYLMAPNAVYQKYKSENDGRLSRVFGVPPDAIGYLRWLEALGNR